MPASVRTTASGACAACGAYGDSQHRPTCDPSIARVIRLGPSRQALVDRRTSDAVRAYERVQRELIHNV